MTRLPEAQQAATTSTACSPRSCFSAIHRDPAGHEKQIRLFSLGKSDAEPRCMAASAPIRSAIVHPEQEHLILSTYVDKPNIE